MKPLKISEPASQELAEAVRWHEERRPGWGERFFDEVVRTFSLLEAYPEIGSPGRGRWPFRRLKVRGFPHVVAYRVRADDVNVVAVAHTSRRPGYWQHRP